MSIGYWSDIDPSKQIKLLGSTADQYPVDIGRLHGRLHVNFILVRHRTEEVNTAQRYPVHVYLSAWYWADVDPYTLFTSSLPATSFNPVLWNEWSLMGVYNIVLKNGLPLLPAKPLLDAMVIVSISWLFSGRPCFQCKKIHSNYRLHLSVQVRGLWWL